MNYKAFCDRLILRVKNDQQNFLRPRGRFSKHARDFAWLKLPNQESFPFSPREAYIIWSFSRKIFGRRLHLELALKANSSRNFDKIFKEVRAKTYLFCKKCKNILDKPRRDGICLTCWPRTGKKTIVFTENIIQRKQSKKYVI